MSPDLPAAWEELARLSVPSVVARVVGLEWWLDEQRRQRLAMATTRFAVRTGQSIDVDQLPSGHGFNRGRAGGRITGIVLHSAETNEGPNVAEALASWLAGPNAPRAGWHFAVDSDSITQSIRDTDTAWHCLSCNPYTIGIEHAGRASQTEAQWLDPYGAAMLERSARLVAFLCEKYDIPVIRPTPEQIRRDHVSGGARGIWGHADATRAGLGGDHTDPGPGFPWDWYLSRVRDLATGAP